MNRLQTRLMVAFLVVLVATLVIIGVVLLVFLSSRPVPTGSIVNDLAATSLELDIRDFVRNTDRNLSANNEQRLREEVLALGEATDYRFLVVVNQNRIAFDTAGEYQAGQFFGEIEREAVRVANRTSPGFVSGYFIDQSDEKWVFASRRLLPIVNPPPENQNTVRQQVDLLVATPEPQQTPRLVIQDFGTTFLLPLCQAGLIGMLLAFGLSALIARSVARPLQAVARAAEKVAAGDYTQQVPVNGPTEARKVARAFNTMTQQVQLNQQAQRDFLANVTHELRTPLTSIQGFSQAIQDGVAAEPEAAQHAASIIHEEAGRLSRMVNELLDLARIQSGKMEMLRHAVEIDRILQNVGTSLNLKAKNNDVRLHLNIPSLFRIAGDGDRLAQVFTNLLDNAIKHTDSGGQVWLSAEAMQNGVQIMVQDTGEGIPPEDLSRIFERFYQVDKSRKRKSESAGIGLAITHEIIQAHGGQIRVESQVGVGTRFIVWLPVLTSNQSTITHRRV